MRDSSIPVPAASTDAQAPTLLPEGRRFEHALTRTGGAPLVKGNRITLSADNARTFDEWVEAIAGAQRWVHLENYIFRADGVGHRIADALAERARAGVPVRILYDWLGSFTTPRSFWRSLRDAGAEVRAVNRLHVAHPLRIINRDHRKLVAVDGTYASVGGVCIADEWLEHSPLTGLPFRDTVVAVHGPVVAYPERGFANVWDRVGPRLPDAERPRPDAIDTAGETAVRVILQEPGRLRIARLITLLTAAVQHRLWIADAYYLAMPSLQEALVSAARDGVDVRMLLPSTNDLPIIGALSRTGYRPLLNAGVRIWEYAGVMMHAKTMVADGWWSRVGSTNLNISGLMANWEIDVIVEDQAFGAGMEAMFENDLAHAREVRLQGRFRRPRPDPGIYHGPERRRTSRQPRGAASSGSARRALASAARLSSAALLSSDIELRRQEQMVAAAVSAVLLVLAVLLFFFPRLIAWPAAAVALFAAILGFRRTFTRPPRR